VVPAHVLNRRKLGFPVPIRHFLAGESYEWARDIILSAQTDEYLDKAAVLQLLEDHKAGRGDHSRQIWTILIFQIWHGIFVTGQIKPEIPEKHYPVRL
jgi:asparagine synthase (glutamine-hydrolysing)